MESVNAPRFTALPPLSLYIHIPWCEKKCGYCDFNSHDRKGQALDEQRYVNALMTDLEMTLPQIWGRSVHTIFFGGGTPSLFSARAIDDILCGVRARLKLAPDAEITLEANPGTFEAQKFADFCAAGINRLSIGIQSFNAQHLHALGRVHDDVQARRAVEIGLRTIGNVNLDLMYALPNQTAAEALADIQTAIAFSPPHISAYQLTLEPNTLFHAHPPALPDDDTCGAIEEAVHSALASAGYDRYEISAFAKPKMQCQHNLNYWKFGDYIGIGAGAHGKISAPHSIARTVKAKQPEHYMQACEAGDATIERREITRKDAGFEFMLNALRLTEGVETVQFSERSGFPISLVTKALAQAEAKGLLAPDPTRIKPSPLGLRYLNDLQEMFLLG
jgi:putative oxygen-independent coproporphyrinogen III oxidase